MTTRLNVSQRQRRIVSGIWLLRELVQAWFDQDSDEHADGCDCPTCEDLCNLAYQLSQQETNLTCQMVGPPDKDESFQTMLAVIREMAAERGMGDVPAQKHGKKRNRLWIKLAELPGNALTR